jgi:hypothetical protein
MGRYEAVVGRSRLIIDGQSSVHPIHVETPIDGYLEAALDGHGLAPEATARGEVWVDVADLRSGNPLVDRETRRRIDARRHPRIVGELTSLVAAGDDGAHHAAGRLTFYGATRPVSGSVSLTVDGDVVTAAGQERFDVRDWGLEPPQLLLLRVDPVVAVDLRMVLRRVG